MNTLTKTIGIALLLIVTTGCGSIEARWTSPSLAYDSGVYRGVQFYAHHLTEGNNSKQVEQNDEQSTPPEFDHHCPGWIFVFVVAFPFLATDALVLTPVFDTILLPYDLITWVCK